MTDQTTSLLAELLDVQKQLLANQSRALEQQQLAIQQQFEAVTRQRRALRLLIPLIVIVGAAILLPYAWQWVLYVSAR